MTYRTQLILPLVLTDVISLAVGLTGALLVRLQLEEAGVAAEFDVWRHLVASLVLGGVMLLSYWANGLYDPDQVLSGTREYGQLTHGAIYAFLLALAFSYFAGPLTDADGGYAPALSRSWLLLTLTLGAGCSMVGRFVLRRIIRMLRRHGAMPVRIVIVGASAAGVSVARHFQASRDDGLKVVGFLDEYLPLGERILEDVEVIGRPSDLTRGNAAVGVDEYVLVPQALSHQRLEEVTALMVSRDHPIVRMLVTPSALLTNGVLVAARAHVPVLTLRRARITGLEAAIKRTFDVSGALFGLIVIGPVALVAVARAWLQGNRPLFRTERVSGTDAGQPILRLLAREVSANIAIRGVPALVGVLIGQFSLVGPRPYPVGIGVESVAAGLTAVKPGLTGEWRLSGRDSTLEEQATRDLAYVREYTVWEDVRILAHSLLTIGRLRSLPPLARWEPLPQPAAKELRHRDAIA